MAQREFKDFKFSLGKDEAEAGRFSGYASVFGVVDSYGDVVERGAFKRSLKAHESFPLLWSHDVTQPIGKITGLEDEKGLKVVGELNLDLTSAQEKRSLMKQGVIKGMSIGYEAIKAPVEDGVRKLKEVKLWEISLVVFPANEKSLVTQIKNAGDPSSLIVPVGYGLERILAMDISTVEIEQRNKLIELAEKVLTLLKADPPKGTQSPGNPSLEPLLNALLKYESQI